MNTRIYKCLIVLLIFLFPVTVNLYAQKLTNKTEKKGQQKGDSANFINNDEEAVNKDIKVYNNNFLSNRHKRKERYKAEGIDPVIEFSKKSKVTKRKRIMASSLPAKIHKDKVVTEILYWMPNDSVADTFQRKFSGLDFGEPLNPEQLRDVCIKFDKYRLEDNAIYDYNEFFTRAHRWMQRNSRNKHIPLILVAVKYNPYIEEQEEVREEQFYFAVGPFKKRSYAKKINFILKDEFIYSNLKDKLEFINLRYYDEIKRIDLNKPLEILFKGQDTLIFKVEAHYKSGEIYYSSFNFIVKPFSDGTWADLTINK